MDHPRRSTSWRTDWKVAVRCRPGLLAPDLAARSVTSLHMSAESAGLLSGVSIRVGPDSTPDRPHMGRKSSTTRRPKSWGGSPIVGVWMASGGGGRYTRSQLAVACRVAMRAYACARLGCMQYLGWVSGGTTRPVAPLLARRPSDMPARPRLPTLGEQATSGLYQWRYLFFPLAMPAPFPQISLTLRNISLPPRAWLQ